MNAGVILAAGDSTRMGFPKQLAEVKDKPLLELVIEKVNSYFDSSTVVLGFENEIIEEKINFYLVLSELPAKECRPSRP